MLNFNRATWSFFPEHKFRRWANLTSIFLIISFLLEQKTWFRVCVVPVVPITSCFIIPLTWCHHWSITSSWNLSTKFVVILINILTAFRISIEFMTRNTILALDDCVIIGHFIAFPPTQTCSCFVFFLGFLAIQQLVFFTLEHYLLLCHQCCENFTTS